MNIARLFLCIEALPYIVMGIRVNMQGSLSLGKDVIEGLSHYLGANIESSRRSLSPPPMEDPITLAVRTALSCKDLEFCQDELQHFVNEYIIILAKAVESILSSEADFNNETYEKQLKSCLKDIRIILEDANAKVEEDSEAYYWTHIIKRINAKFQNINDITNYKNHESEETDLRNKIIIATAFIERKYLTKLCSDYNLCSKSHQCTRGLNKLLFHFKTMPDDRIRIFIKYFYEALFDTTFYSHLNPTTTNEFQIILNDMSYANDTPTKDIMLSVLKTVEAKMEMLQLKKDLRVAHDILIAHTILSDVDHMFSNNSNAFTTFLNKFYDWLASDIRLEKHIRSVLSDISKQILSYEEDLGRKLIDEVKVFLDMTVNVKEK